MIKKLMYTLVVCAVVLALSACKKDVPPQITDNYEEVPTETESINSNSINEVLDEHFDSFVSDVYSHPQDYNGLKYRLRAYYRVVEHDEAFINYLAKGTDERWMGFAIETDQSLPTPGSLILAEGTLKVRFEDNQDTPYFEIESIEILREK